MKKNQDSKVNRIYEKELFNFLYKDLKYEFMINIFLSEEEVVQNYNQHYKKLLESFVEIEDEIDDNLIFISNEQSQIYLKRLLIKANKFLNYSSKKVKYCQEKKFEKIFNLFLEDIKKRKDIIGYTQLLFTHKTNIIKKVIRIIENKIELYSLAEPNNIKLKWVGKPSQLGFIIGQLVSLQYIETPSRKNGEINYTQLAKLVKKTFNTDAKESSLAKYLNLDSEKSKEVKRHFEDESFLIPHKSIMS